MNIITHRGLNPADSDFPAESTYEAFVEFLKQGWGLEFDPCFTKDKRIVVFHDDNLGRITAGKNTAKFADLTVSEIKKIRLGKNGHRLCSLDELLDEVARHGAPLSALHLKSRLQNKASLDLMLSYLKNFPVIFKNLLLFDVTIETAQYLKKKMPELIMAPSVSHFYDIKRYNICTGGTLYSIEEVLKNKDLFNWVWLDEWDLSDENGRAKRLYNEENFSIFKNAGLKIALVTPELHGTSPGLLGGEAHPDADKNRLFPRIREIIDLKPDAVCTDHPEAVQKMT
ncbi:hypothetical protein A2303_04790 [Candidatus Falkowbacteria bacterium RIFOXYB2_FULL_47_14]|uniref:GP-PDE domain-containing protein n=1 Tax=Candidatus Falkowbacteria bacterium RIFOXYA2_FULL_47_19 TaxID=1797994 RepID=A0A1F5SHE1_9BACT|nr:MAG: hypothetical protein A2227_02625 [Candidatus Falkowbacteria bacterium RIFOXYA2_FULL_47_19]OGF35819.1 MAG: hypothetical protein A2468_03810 [Candidatus Falkowbacteria bacterium RIFOXYC2_FULL_46_15]OGF42692.1 MAG: hypothetical protein A2303_04790 [Candidatus Falkowbacteria bacterium RIFOXYB2_FULL_47_14]